MRTKIIMVIICFLVGLLVLGCANTNRAVEEVESANPTNTNANETMTQENIKETLERPTIDVFREGMALMERDGRVGFIDEAGNEVIPPVFCAAENFCGGVAVVQQNGKWGIIDITGELVSPLIYDRMGLCFGEEGLMFFIRDGGLGYINREGVEVVPPIYDYSFHQCGSSTAQSAFFGGLAKVSQNGYFGYINPEGNEVIPIIYDSTNAWTNHSGLVFVSKGDQRAAYDRTGQVVIPLTDNYDYFNYMIEMWNQE